MAEGVFLRFDVLGQGRAEGDFLRGGEHWFGGLFALRGGPGEWAVGED